MNDLLLIFSILLAHLQNFQCMSSDLLYFLFFFLFSLSPFLYNVHLFRFSSSFPCVVGCMVMLKQWPFCLREVVIIVGEGIQLFQLFKMLKFLFQSLMIRSMGFVPGEMEVFKGAGKASSFLITEEPSMAQLGKILFLLMGHFFVEWAFVLVDNFFARVMYKHREPLDYQIYGLYLWPIFIFECKFFFFF